MKTYTAMNAAGTKRFYFWFDPSLRSWVLSPRDAGGHDLDGTEYFGTRDALFVVLGQHGVAHARELDGVRSFALFPAHQRRRAHTDAGECGGVIGADGGVYSDADPGL